MKIGVVGINHHLTPIDIREKFNFTESSKIEASSILQNYLDEIVILSTCNRSEIYYALPGEDDAKDTIVDFFRDYFSFEDIEDYIFYKTDDDAVRHLFLVAGGLDSIVIGEDQILGQVRDAIEFAMDLKFSKKILNRLFQTALNVGKKIRSNIGISSVPISTSYIGIKLLQRDLGSFEGKSALIIGAGEISELAIKYLNEGNLSHIYISNRSDGRLEPLFEKFPKLEKVRYEDRYEILQEVDMLISATAAAHTVIKFENFKQRDKDLFILDLGLPRDIDERLEYLRNVKIYTLDDLEEESTKNKIMRLKLGKQAEKLIEEDVEEFMEWVRATKVDPILSSLNYKIEEIKEDSLNYLDRKLELNPREKVITEEVVSYALNRITREARLCIKDNPDDKQISETMAELFNLEV